MEKINSRIRAAISAGNWSEANHLLDELAGEIGNAWRASATDEERQALERDVLDTLQWARTSVLASRAQDHDQLIQLTRSRGYSRASGDAAGLNFDA